LNQGNVPCLIGARFDQIDEGRNIKHKEGTSKTEAGRARDSNQRFRAGLRSIDAYWRAAHLMQLMRDKLTENQHYI
jgi:hypothetical protein